MILLKSVDLQPLNTLAVPSTAEFYAKATSVDEIKQALAWARKHKKPVFVMGGGSNSLLPENIDGLVLKPAVRGVAIVGSDANTFLVKSGAGENWHRFVQYCLHKKYYGLENLIYIPGLVGAAPIQNIGAYGVELKDFFEKLEAVDCRTGKVEVFDRDACEFGYRDSVFKNQHKQRYIVTSVYFRLHKQPHVSDSYPALSNALSGIPRRALTPELVANAVTEIRRDKIPAPESIPNCGSFFKNPIVDNEIVARLKQTYPDVVAYDVDATHKKIAAGWLIEKAGWKGRSAFDVSVHDNQALIIVNPQKKPLKNVLQLAETVKSSIKTYFGVELEFEPQRLEPVSF